MKKFVTILCIASSLCAYANEEETQNKQMELANLQIEIIKKSQSALEKQNIGVETENKDN